MARAVVFAHYDRDGMVDDYVVDALQSYRRIAERLVVVSASAARLPEPLMRSVDQFIPRENIGYDFCSWRDGIESLGDVGRFDELLCVNDSVYGPFAGLEETLARRQRTNGDLWGMCLSQQGPKSRGRRSCPHVQSWFFAMRRPILQSHSFAEFWACRSIFSEMVFEYRRCTTTVPRLPLGAGNSSPICLFRSPRVPGGMFARRLGLFREIRVSFSPFGSSTAVCRMRRCHCSE
jgi:hypothetical protein